MVNQFMINMEMKSTINKLYILLGAFIVCYILFIRLIWKRLPKELSTDLPEYLMLFYLLIISMFIVLIIINIFHLFNKTIHPNKGLKIISQFIQECLYTFDEYIKNKDYTYFSLGSLLQSFCSVYVYCVNRNSFKKHRYLLVLFDILPKVIMASVFLFEIIFMHKINYFYKLSGLLLLPLVFNYVIYTLKDFCTRNLEIFDTILCITDINDNIVDMKDYCRQKCYFYLTRGNRGSTVFFARLSKTFINENVTKSYDEKATLYHFMEVLDVFIQVKEQLFVLYYIKERWLYINIFINIIIYLLYIISWAYTIWYGYS